MRSRFLLLFLCSLALSRGQQLQPSVSDQPDCSINFILTGVSTGAQAADNTAGTSGIINNQTGGVACYAVRVSYNSRGFTGALNLHLQVAPNAAGNVHGTWADFSGTLTIGINPNTAVTQAFTAGNGYFPYLRMNLIGATGVGVVTGTLYGFKERPGADGSSGGGCTAPCVVIGPTASGSPPVNPPVLVAGWDLTNLHTVLTDATGQVRTLDSQTVYTGADGQNNSVVAPGTGANVNFYPTYPSIFGGSTWDRQFVCTQRVRVVLTDATLTALVAVSGTTKVRLCQVHVTTAGSSENISIIEGTGVACAGGPATIDSYLNVLGFSTDYGESGALRSTAANGVCVQQSGAAQTTHVVATYAQF